MTWPDISSSLARQRFKSQENYALPTLSTHLCAESRKRFVYWHDIQVTFESIFYLLDRSEERLLFMIDENAELHRPLRIEHNPDEEYTVVYIDGEGVQSDNYRYQEDNSVASPIDFFAPLERLVATTMYLFDRLKLVPNAARETFLQLVANARYYHILLMEEIARLDESGFKARFGEIDRAQVLIQLQELEDQVPDWDYRNVCFNMFYGVQTKWDYATSKLFIVLPSDLKSWDDKNSSTHNFRLYFLCDNRMDVVAQSRIPQHVHISNHPGYNLLKPQEFFKKYGDYVLRVLWMVKLGYSNNACDIPSIHTPSILWKHTHASSILTKFTIRKLVDKAISHIEQISPPKWVMVPGLSRNQSAGIKEYFHVQEGDNAEGNLQRHIDSHQCVSWRCQVHKEQHFDWKHLIDLKGYVDGRMGHVDMQQARLQVSLQSYADSNQLQRRLAGITQSFNLSIKLSWNTTRTDVEKLCRTIAQRKTVALEIDGISVNIYPRGYVPYTRNIFADNVVPDTDTGLQLITVLNYPVLDEHCIHIGNFSLQSGLSPTRLTHSWVELRADLDRFGKLMSNAQEMSECKAELRSVQKKHGLSETTFITMYGGNWGAVFDLKDCAVVEAYSLDAACPRAVHSSGSLRKLTVDLHDLKFDEEFFQLVKTSPDLHELNVSYRGHDVFYYFEHIVKGWQESSSRYCLTLLDRLEDTQGRVVARMTVQRCGSEGSGSALRADQLNSMLPSAQKKVMDAPSTNINYLDWNIDQVSAQVFGRTATLLDMATQQHSSALKLFTLDISQLEVDGLASVQSVLERSRLEHLNIVCNPIDPTLSQAVLQVLGAVKWETIKSLVLSGNDVNEWLDLCPSPEAPQLLSLQICGTGLAPQELTHSSVLFIHQLAYENTLERLDFKGVRMKEASDWTVIMDAVDPAYLKSLGLCESSMTQLQSNTDATDLFDAKFNKSVGSAAQTPVPMPRTFEDMVTRRLSSIKSKISRDDAPQTSPSTSERSNDSAPQTPSPRLQGVQDIMTWTPPATPPSEHDAEAQELYSMTQEIQDIAEQTPPLALPSTHDVVAQELPAILQQVQDIKVQTLPWSLPTGHDVAAQEPHAITQEIHDIGTQTPPLTPPSAHDVVVQEMPTTLQQAQDIAGQTPSSTPPSAHDVVAQVLPAIPQEVQDIVPLTTPARQNRLQADMVQGSPTGLQEAQQIAVLESPSRPQEVHDPSVGKTTKDSFWSRICCCGGRKK